jgi:hypothetical protein
MRIEEEGWLVARRVSDRCDEWLAELKREKKPPRRWSRPKEERERDIRKDWQPWQTWRDRMAKDAVDRCLKFQQRVEMTCEPNPFAKARSDWSYVDWNEGPELLKRLVRALAAAQRTTRGIVESHDLSDDTPLHKAVSGIGDELSKFEKTCRLCRFFSTHVGPPKGISTYADWYFKLLNGIAKRRRILEREVERQAADKHERERSSRPKAGARRRGKTKPKTISARKLEEAPVSQREKSADWLAKALLLVRDHPKWSDRFIAQRVGVHPSTLSRSREYQMAAAMARGSKDDLRRGQVTVDPETGQQDIEAYDDQPGRPAWDED